MINQVQGAGISTEQQKKTWLINWYFENDPTSSIYLATLRNPALVASYQTSPGNLYGTPFATGMENYFQKIKAHFGQSMFDQLLTEFAQQSNLYVDEIKVDEWHIYGSSRLGVYEANKTISRRVARDLNNDNQITNNEYVVETPEEVLYLFSSYQLERGAKRYELANHLGNVLTVISDKKTANFTGSTFTHFTVERISATDYSPFGAPLAGRTWNGGEYRYGFNGQEKDDEITGVGNTMTAEFWEYDSRLSRRLNTDPVDKPWLTPYHSFGNKPILNIDPNGANDTKYVDEDGTTLAETSDGNNSTIVIEKNKVDTFKKMKEIGEKKGIINSEKFNMILIHAMTPSTKGIYFTNQKYALRYMKAFTKLDGHEYQGYFLDKGFYVDASEGIDVSDPKKRYYKNDTWSSPYTEVKDGKIKIDGVVYKVTAMVHTHKSNNFFSGLPLDYRKNPDPQWKKFGVLPPITNGDWSTFQSEYWTNKAKINQFYLIADDVYRLTFNRNKAFTPLLKQGFTCQDYKVENLGSSKKFLE